MVNRSELLECLRFIRGHLYGAMTQLLPTDDQIIAQHVEAAYKRCAEVLREVDSTSHEDQLQGAVISAAQAFTKRRADETERQLLEAVYRMESGE